MGFDYHRSFGGAGPHILIKPCLTTGAAFSFSLKFCYNDNVKLPRIFCH